MNGYWTLLEAARQWGVSRRRINTYCNQGRILGAMKFAGSWIIPQGAAKPEDPRKKKMPRDLAGIPPSSKLWQASPMEVAYLQGRFGDVLLDYFAQERQGSFWIKQAPLGIAASISLGDYPLYMKIKEELQQIMEHQPGSEEACLAELAIATAFISMSSSIMVPSWMKEGRFFHLPEDRRIFSLYLYSKYLYMLHQDVAALATAKAALALCKEGDDLMGIYLRIVIACAAYREEKIQEASSHLEEAMRLGLPRGFITPFAELLSALYVLAEPLLLREYPSWHQPIVDQWKQICRHWITFHNRFTQDNIPLLLTLREGQIAQLLANGLSYAEIARRLKLSRGGVNNAVTSIYQKLCIQKKSELRKYIL